MTLLNFGGIQSELQISLTLKYLSFKEFSKKWNFELPIDVANTRDEDKEWFPMLAPQRLRSTNPQMSDEESLILKIVNWPSKFREVFTNFI